MNADNPFYLNGGGSIQNLSELRQALQSMDDATFTHHVNEHKNDFSEWIKHSLHDETLAEAIHKTKDPKSMQQKISEHMNKETMAAVTKAIEQIPKKIPASRKVKPAKTKKPKPAKKKPTQIEVRTTSVRTRIERKSKPRKQKRKTKQDVKHKSSKNNHVDLPTLATYIAFGIVVGVALTIMLYLLFNR